MKSERRQIPKSEPPPDYLKVARAFAQHSHKNNQHGINVDFVKLNQSPSTERILKVNSSKLSLSPGGRDKVKMTLEE